MARAQDALKRPDVWQRAASVFPATRTFQSAGENHMNRLTAVLLLALGLAGCDQGRWIELPPILMSCQDLDDKNIKADMADADKFSLTRGMMQGVCTQQGAGNFSGGIRCEKEAVQIQCRS
jgi:hypothetical protein